MYPNYAIGGKKMNNYPNGQIVKREWKKEDKKFYLPKARPELIEIPAMKFYTLEGVGDPNCPTFSAYIETLYQASYSVRMSHKGKEIPKGYYEYTVYPLEGIWSLTEEGIHLQNQSGAHSVQAIKNHLKFKLMIRQPDFLTEALSEQLLEKAHQKKNNVLLSAIKLEMITDGLCIQMLHNGSYDEEPESFAQMEAFASAEGYQRRGMTHREIYLSDARKVKPEALKTVLRFWVE